MEQKKIHMMRNINIIARCAVLYRDSELAGTGLGGCQTPYVIALCRTPGLTQEQLAKELHVNRSSVARQAALLEKAGFVTRVRSDADKRAVQVFPTEKMRRMEPVIRRVNANWRLRLTEVLTEKEMDALEELLARLAARAEDLE